MIEYVLLHNKLDQTWSKNLFSIRLERLSFGRILPNSPQFFPFFQLRTSGKVLFLPLSLVYSFPYIFVILSDSTLNTLHCLQRVLISSTNDKEQSMYIVYFITLLHSSYYEKWHHIVFTAVKPINYVCSTEK